MTMDFPTSSTSPRADYGDVDLWSSHRATDMTVEQATTLLEAVDQVPGATVEVLEVSLTEGTYVQLTSLQGLHRIDDYDTVEQITQITRFDGGHGGVQPQEGRPHEDQHRFVLILSEDGITDGPYDAEPDDPYFAAQGAVERAYENLGLRPTEREPTGWLLTVASIAAAFAVWQLIFFPLADARVGGFWQMWFPLIVAGIVWMAVIAGISAISSRTWPHWLQAEQVRSGRRPANLAALGVLAVSAIVTAVGLG